MTTMTSVNEVALKFTNQVMTPRNATNDGWRGTVSLKQYNWLRSVWTKCLSANNLPTSTEPQAKYHPDFPKGELELKGATYEWRVEVGTNDHYVLAFRRSASKANELHAEALALLEASKAYYTARDALKDLTREQRELLVMHDAAMSKALVEAAARYSAAKEEK